MDDSEVEEINPRTRARRLRIFGFLNIVFIVLIFMSLSSDWYVVNTNIPEGMVRVEDGVQYEIIHHAERSFTGWELSSLPGQVRPGSNEIRFPIMMGIFLSPVLYLVAAAVAGLVSSSPTKISWIFTMASASMVFMAHNGLSTIEFSLRNQGSLSPHLIWGWGFGLQLFYWCLAGIFCLTMIVAFQRGLVKSEERKLEAEKAASDGNDKPPSMGELFRAYLTSRVGSSPEPIKNTQKVS